METRVLPDAAAVAEAGAALFVERCAAAVSARGRFAVALTGGSTPGPLHQALAAPARRDAIDWKHVHVFFGDERAVPPDAKESNHGAARERLLRHVPIPNENVHRMEAEREDLEQAARDYEARLVSVCGGVLDLLFVGVGRDAHVLSLYPGAEAIDEERALVVAERDPPMDPALSRITMTKAAVLRARYVVALACGEEKKRAVRLSIEGAEDRHSYPAQVLRQAADGVWLLDRAAALELRLGHDPDEADEEPPPTPRR